MSDEQKKTIDRRVVLKGAAWSVPVLAAAVATPMAAASVTPPTCPTCFTTGDVAAIVPGLNIAATIVAGNKGLVNLTGVFGVNAPSSCNLNLFQPVYTSIVTSATLTMSDGNSYGARLNGLGTATGTFGEIGALGGSFFFDDVAFPNGVYALNSGPVHPLSIAIHVTIALIGLPNLVTINCPVTLHYDLSNMWAVGTVLTVPIVGPVGAGTVAWLGYPVAQ
jgi:hypothetical protein